VSSAGVKHFVLFNPFPSDFGSVVGLSWSSFELLCSSSRLSAAIKKHFSGLKTDRVCCMSSIKDPSMSLPCFVLEYSQTITTLHQCNTPYTSLLPFVENVFCGSQDCYEVLGVDRNADISQIQKVKIQIKISTNLYLTYSNSSVHISILSERRRQPVDLQIWMLSMPKLTKCFPTLRRGRCTITSWTTLMYAHNALLTWSSRGFQYCI